MKTFLRRFAWSFVLCVAQPVVAKNDQLSVDNLVPLGPRPVVTLGMTHAVVVKALGEPGDKLTPDVWVYWNFRHAVPTAPEGADTLVVAFSSGRVSQLRLTERKAVMALATQVRANRARALAAAVAFGLQ